MHIFVKIQGNIDRQPWLRQCHMLDVRCHIWYMIKIFCILFPHYHPSYLKQVHDAPKEY